MKPFFLLFIPSILLYSCNPKTEDKAAVTAEITKPTIKISGTTYFFAPVFDAKNCEAIGECDCCTWDILFIDDTNFITLCPCVDGDSILKGTYEILKDKVILTYGKLQIDGDYNWEVETDTTRTAKPEYFVTVSKARIDKHILKPRYCKDKLYFEMETEEGMSYGIVDPKFSLEQQISILKEKGIWGQVIE